MKLRNVAKRRLELAQVAKSLANPLAVPAFNREAGAFRASFTCSPSNVAGVQSDTMATASTVATVLKTTHQA
jgi:hypothetical protein